MASPARNSVDPQGATSTATPLDLGSGLQINIYCTTVIIERPHPSRPSTPPWGVWVRSGGILDFIRTLYQNILDRDPENQEALEYHTRKTYNDGLASTVGGFFNSPEYTSKGLSTEATVDKLYLSILGRQSDAGGKAHHVQLIQEGMTLSKVAEWFVVSEEYRGRVRAGTSPDPIHWPKV